MLMALALGGCTPKQDVAQCELEAIRLYPDANPSESGGRVDRYADTCM